MTDHDPDQPTVDGDAPGADGGPLPTAAPQRHDSEAAKRTVLGLCIARYVVPIASLALLPGLLREDVSDGFLYTLFAVRPGREVMLFTGYLYRADGRPNLVLLYLAGFAFFVAATWVFFLLGRMYRTAIRTGDGPAWLQRLAPPEYIEIAQRALVRRGPIVAFLVRVGGLPPTILGAAAGVSDTRPVPYLVADAVGSVITFALTVGVGYGLGQAYERGGRWFLIGGIVIIIGLSSWFSNWMQRELAREEGTSDGTPST